MERTQRVTDMALAIADTDEYSGGIPSELAKALPSSFSEEVNIPWQHMNTLSGFLGEYESVEELLDTSWSAALKCQALRYYEQKVIFPIDAMRGDGETPLEVSIKQGDPSLSNGHDWYVSYVNTYTKPIST